MKLAYHYTVGQFSGVLSAELDRLKRAGTAAITEAGKMALSLGRASIAAGGRGFGRKWQSALHLHVYPQNAPSLHAAATITDKIPYAGIFEEGGTISGQPLLWLPLPNVPSFHGRPLSASKFKAVTGQPLRQLNRPGKPPLLAAYIRVTDERAAKGLSLSLLRRGSNINVIDRKVKRGRGRLVIVPVYIGFKSVAIAKKFDIAGAATRARAALPAIFAAKLAALPPPR